MVFQRVLDFRRIDVHPARDDHVLLAVADVVEPVLVEIGDVAHGLPAVPAVFHELVVGLVVGREHARRAHEQLARLVGLVHRVAFLVEELDLDPRRRLPAGAFLLALVLRPQHRVHPQLGGAVDLEQRVLGEPVQVGHLQRVRPGRRVGDHDPHAGAVVAFEDRLVELDDPADRRRRREGRRDLVLVHQPQPVLGVEAALDDRGVAEVGGDGQETARARVVERSGGDVHVVRGVADHFEQPQGLLGIADAGAHRALGFSGGARRVDHGARLGAGGRRLDGAGRLGVQQRLERLHVPAGLAVEHQHVGHPGRLGADGLEQLDVFGVDEADLGVGVVCDVRRLFRGQPVVERHRHGADLARRVAAGHRPERIVAAPQHPVAGFDAVVQEHPGQAVGVGFELGEAPLEHRAVGTVVDERGFVLQIVGKQSQRIGRGLGHDGLPSSGVGHL